jgi:hypothetical protein
LNKTTTGASARDAQPKIGFWHMLRDVLVASINKGQFPIALLGIICICIVLRLPAGDVSKLAFGTVDALVRGALFGYLFSVALIIAWWKHANFLTLKLQQKGDNIES